MIRYNDFARTYKGIDEIVRSLLVVGNGISRKKISAGVAKLWSTTSNFDRKTVIPIGIGQPESIFLKRFRAISALGYANCTEISKFHSNNFLERAIPSFAFSERHRVLKNWIRLRRNTVRVIRGQTREKSAKIGQNFSYQIYPIFHAFHCPPNLPPLLFRTSTGNLNFNLTTSPRSWSGRLEPA